MSEEQITQVGPRNEARSASTALQRGIRSTEEAELPHQLTTLERIKAIQNEIFRIQTTNKCRDSEAMLYTSLASLLKELGNERTKRTKGSDRNDHTDRNDGAPEVELAGKIAQLCNSRENAGRSESTGKFEQEAYDRLLWFSTSWNEVDTLRVTGKAEEGRLLAIELFNVQKKWKFTSYPSEIWRKQGNCEVVLKLEADWKESFSIADRLMAFEPLGASTEQKSS
ncbi:hypothetical protein LEL_03696 [Akanthomyces lecanii RCEF 1005]|uniref:Uncharacterized protein n=1 Tax=Akanthomyces lecanii RCEF 1005 TaxID=1081108 RepID=A0A168JB37_CORDF|nr:hypothetical protein LEL_03696 [Akanthomyces lecanii RCEF 1005]